MPSACWRHFLELLFVIIFIFQIFVLLFDVDGVALDVFSLEIVFVLGGLWVLAVEELSMYFAKQFVLR